MTREAILKEALHLDPKERVRLIDDLWCSFGDDPDALALTPAQAKDLEARIAEDAAGQSDPIPWEVVRERLSKRS